MYAVGYLHTSASQPTGLVADPTSLPADSVQQPAATPTRTTGQVTSPVTSQRTSPTRVASTPTPAAKATSGYTDGTFTGTGTSRHGNIEVSVVIQGGKITSAQITSCQTRYPCSKVAALPGQVVTRQSASVSYVSGSTDSSKAFAGAVAAALAKAKV